MYAQSAPPGPRVVIYLSEFAPVRKPHLWTRRQPAFWGPKSCSRHHTCNQRRNTSSRDDHVPLISPTARRRRTVPGMRANAQALVSHHSEPRTRYVCLVPSLAFYYARMSCTSPIDSSRSFFPHSFSVAASNDLNASARLEPQWSRVYRTSVVVHGDVLADLTGIEPTIHQGPPRWTDFIATHAAHGAFAGKSVMIIPLAPLCVNATIVDARSIALPPFRRPLSLWRSSRPFKTSNQLLLSQFRVLANVRPRSQSNLGSIG